jgi:hypothetical protein
MIAIASIQVRQHLQQARVVRSARFAMARYCGRGGCPLSISPAWG